MGIERQSWGKMRGKMTEAGEEIRRGGQWLVKCVSDAVDIEMPQGTGRLFEGVASRVLMMSRKLIIKNELDNFCFY